MTDRIDADGAAMDADLAEACACDAMEFALDAIVLLAHDGLSQALLETILGGSRGRYDQPGCGQSDW